MRPAPSARPNASFRTTGPRVVWHLGLAVVTVLAASAAYNFVSDQGPATTTAIMVSFLSGVLNMKSSMIRRFGTKQAAVSTGRSFWDLSDKLAPAGDPYSFEQARGKIVYGVNVASNWGLTKMEYALLRDIHKNHPEVVLMAFPSPDFGDQEFKDPAKVVEFAETHGPPGLVVFMPDHVKVEPVREAYAWLATELGSTFTSTLVWNFKGKFIVDQGGNPHVTSNPLKDLPKFISGECGSTEFLGTTSPAAGTGDADASEESCAASAPADDASAKTSAKAK